MRVPDGVVLNGDMHCSICVRTFVFLKLMCVRVVAKSSASLFVLLDR